MTIDLSEEKLESYKEKSILLCIQNDAPSIASVRKYQGEVVAKAMIIYFLNSIDKLLNLKQKLTAFQLDYAADLILEDYPNMKPSDIRLAIRKGLMKEIYNRVDVQVVLGWFRDYWVERMDVSANSRQTDHHNLKNSRTEKAGLEILRKAFEVNGFQKKEEVKAVDFTFEQFKTDLHLMQHLQQDFDNRNQSDDFILDFDTFARYQYESLIKKIKI